MVKAELQFDKPITISHKKKYASSVQGINERREEVHKHVETASEPDEDDINDKHGALFNELYVDNISETGDPSAESLLDELPTNYPIFTALKKIYARIKFLKQAQKENREDLRKMENTYKELDAKLDELIKLNEEFIKINGVLGKLFNRKKIEEIIEKIRKYLKIFENTSLMQLKFNKNIEITPETVKGFIDSIKRALDLFQVRIGHEKSNINSFEKGIQKFLIGFNKYRERYVEKYNRYCQEGRSVNLEDNFVFHELVINGLPDDIDYM